MNTTPTHTAADAPEKPKLTRTQKLAALLIIIGPENAAQILKGLGDPEMQLVSAEMARMPMIDRELQMEVLREFSEVAVQASTGLRGGVEFAQTALEKAVGTYKASEIIGRVAPVPAPVSAMQQLVEKDIQQIFNVLKGEQPQAIALVISFLSPDKASELLSLLPDESREHVVERLATLAPTPIEVVEKLAEILIKKIGAKATRALNQTGGVKPAATVLNAMRKDVSKTILSSLEARNPELTKQIRHKMFTFEDLVRLDATALQRIMREVELRNLAVALKTSGEPLKAKLLSCISKRAAETVNEEMSFMGSVKSRDVEAAQFGVIEIARKLENEGEIDLSEAQAAHAA